MKRSRFVALAAIALAGCTSEAADPGSTTAAPVPTTASDPRATNGDVAALDDAAAAATPTGSATTTTTAAAATTTIDPDAVFPEGFDTVAGRVIAPDGSICDVCLWLADDADRRRRGLMFVTDLGPADGMAFVYDSPHTGRFWMRNTPLPLSIAFFDDDGVYLDDFDMEPCGDSDTCLRYRTPDDFLVAVEAPQGELAALGIAPGSVLELSDAPCT